MKISRIAMCILLLMAIFAGAASSVNGECSACKGGSPTAQQDVLNNEWAVFLGKENATAVVMSSANGLITPQYSRQNNPSLQTVESSSDSFASVLVPLEGANDSGIIIDISPNPTEYIPGAISIPYTKFLGPGAALKPVSEMAAVLGEAGISQDDAVLIYGECQPCGGGPSAATYVYWIMLYLGHENVKLLDGGIDDWVAAMQPTVTQPASLPSQSYAPAIKADLLATYEFVHSGTPQIIDARTAKEYEAGSIPGSVNIPYDRVLDGKRIRGLGDLEELFSTLDKNRPVVVYTNTGVKASMIWLALNLLDYDARIYSWQDWQANSPHLNIAMQKAYAKPNPAKIGDVVQITAVFEEKNISSAENVSQNESETILTIKGCATCGFGSPQGYADLSSTGGVVKIGSTSQAQKSAAEKGFTVSAQVLSPSGDTVSRVIMKRIKSDGDEFAGIWNANAAAGVYRVDIVATLGEVTETFPDAMQIEVVGTSKYKNLGNE
ncbi:MAG: rhodanese-like domain-containing protein [Methanothrix sp.]|nr:rhodanese-like domain-containing protein [Methanothrix sp.]